MTAFEQLESRSMLHGTLWDIQKAGADRDDVLHCLMEGCALTPPPSLPHQDNPEQQAEHLYLFSLFPVSEASTTKIVVPAGETLTVDACLTAEWIRVQGTLDIRPGAEIRVDTIVTDPTSTLNVTGGTVTFIDGPLRSDDPLQLSRGLIAHGAVSIKGEPEPITVDDLTRSVTFRSENPAGVRGHVMMMHNASRVVVEYAAFNDLGRTRADEPVTDPLPDGTLGDNPRGRYSLHFHRGGVGGLPGTVVGAVVRDAKKLGIVNHSSHVIVDQSIVSGFDGSAFFAEAGNELGAFTNNIAINGNRGIFSAVHEHILPERRAVQDFGFSGVGYWLQAGGVTLDGNTAINVKTGVMSLVEPLKENGQFVTLNGTAIDRVPFTITDTTVINAELGIFLNHLGSVQPPIGRNSVIDGVELVNVRDGISFAYSAGVDVSNVRAIGDMAGIAFSGNGVEDQISYRNVSVERFNVCIRPSYIDGFAGGDYELLVEDAYFNCRVGIATLSPNRPLATQNMRRIYTDITFGSLPPELMPASSYYGWPHPLEAGVQYPYWQETYP